MSKYDQRRKRLIEKYESAYKIFPSPPWVCVYCRFPADSLDHVPPLSAVDRVGMDHIEKQRVSLFKFWCCRQCNGLLGDKELFTVEQRRKYLAKRFMQKHLALIESASWTVDDLSELGRGMRKYVQDHADLGEWARRKLENLSTSLESTIQKPDELGDIL